MMLAYDYLLNDETFWYANWCRDEGNPTLYNKDRGKNDKIPPKD